MSKLLGNDYRLWIESATPGTYYEIKGQTSTKISRAAASIDTSTKDDYPYGTEAPGLKTLTADFEILPNLPDVNGYGRLEARSQQPAPTKFQIRKNGAAGGPSDVVFEASMRVGNFDSDYPMNGVVKCTGQLKLAEAPTIDALG